MCCRLHHLEESVKNLESIRFDLSTRNAELQEKVVKVQEQFKGLQERPPEEQDSTRVEGLTRQLDDANKQIMKLKAQQKTKVKNLNKQLDELRKVRSDASSRFSQY
jgi:chromosome segregation ATPase